MSFVVGGFKAVVAQPNTMACWATVYSMMLSWKRQQSFDIAGAVGSVGSKYLTYFQANTGLPSAEFASFLRAAGMGYQPMANLPVSDWEDLLQRHVLLWVGTLASSSPGSGLHSRIIEGIVGSSSSSSANFMIIDPAGGRRYNEPFVDFVRKYEGAIRGARGDYYQIRHFA